jgi:hypothetical protein
VLGVAALTCSGRHALFPQLLGVIREGSIGNLIACLGTGLPIWISAVVSCPKIKGHPVRLALVGR